MPDSVDLVVVGGPTYAFGLTRASTREEATGLALDRLVSRHIGLREWLDGLGPARSRTLAATFDTRMAKPPLPGSAARAAARRLRRRGFEVITDPTSFYVGGTQGPLRSGELERARTWGAHLGSLALEAVGAANPAG